MASVEWVLDSLTSIGGHAVSVVGAPRVAKTSIGPAVEFNGSSDGLLVDVNPIQGLAQFTVEALFEPAADGPDEQRFLHISETASENRLLMETRTLPDRSWCLDTFLRHGDVSLTLMDRQRTHPAGGWHAVALVFDGTAMAHYVDGARELTGNVAFETIGAGRTSIGMRQNLVSWFKGKIRLVRITPEALPAARLMTVAETVASSQETDRRRRRDSGAGADRSQRVAQVGGPPAARSATSVTSALRARTDGGDRRQDPARGRSVT